VPGASMELSFAMLPTSYVFKAGHRVQLTVTGADHRERDRDPGIDGTTLTLRSSGLAASYIDLPLVASPAVGTAGR
jgi:uncharacterized protein